MRRINSYKADGEPVRDPSLLPLIGSARSSAGGVRLASQSLIIEDIVLLKWLGFSFSRAGHWISSRLEGVEVPLIDSSAILGLVSILKKRPLIVVLTQQKGRGHWDEKEWPDC
jgi:hypothetical protein